MRLAVSADGRGREKVRPLTEVEPELLRKTTDEITALIAERLPMMSSADDDAGGVRAAETARADILARKGREEKVKPVKLSFDQRCWPTLGSPEHRRSRTSPGNEHCP